MSRASGLLCHSWAPASAFTAVLRRSAWARATSTDLKRLRLRVRAHGPGLHSTSAGGRGASRRWPYRADRNARPTRCARAASAASRPTVGGNQALNDAIKRWMGTPPPPLPAVRAGPRPARGCDRPRVRRRVVGHHADERSIAFGRGFDPGQAWTHVGVVSRIGSNGAVWMIDAPGAQPLVIRPANATFGRHIRRLWQTLTLDARQRSQQEARPARNGLGAPPDHFTSTTAAIPPEQGGL